MAESQKHKANAAALGLKKIGDTTVQPDNACYAGQDRKDRLTCSSVTEALVAGGILHQ